MRDYFPIPPIPALSRAVQPLADKYNFPTLPLHIHEVLFAAGLYTYVHLVVSPWASRRWFPSHYPTERARRVNWDSHVVSLVQSVLINTMALLVMFFDTERKAMDREQRIWGYTGAAGLVQAFAAGYFVWDLVVTLLYIDVFGLGLLAHASCALAVYAFGFRPFLNYYGCTFILYELSTPFLNFHWFFDKLQMTGSRAQLYNGITLLFVFFSCRLVWGTVQSSFVYIDMWHAVRQGPTMPLSSETPVNASIAYGNRDVMFFAKDAAPIPVWLALVYSVANLTLNMLNFYWFQKMIKAVRKRFVPEDKKEAIKEKEVPAQGVTTGSKIGMQFEEIRRRASEVVPPIEVKGDLAEMQ